MSAPLTLNQPAVIDLGTALTKSGFAGSPTPTSIIPTAVARPTLPRALPPTGPQPALPLVGAAIAPLSGVVRVTYPLRRGVVEAAADASAVLGHVLESELRVAPGAHPVLVTENACGPRRNREWLAEVFFETFQVPSLYIAVPAVLALYAGGRTTGVVLDVGDGVTTALPVAHGHVSKHAMVRLDLGGRDVEDRLAAMLRAGGSSLLTSSSERDAVRRIKERLCCVARSVKDEEARWRKGEEEATAYELPDGNVVEVGVERFRAPEILFQPSLDGLECPGVAEAVHEAVQGMDAAMRKELYGSVVLAGGASKTRGFAQRLVDELRPLPPPATKIRVHAPPDRLVSAYTGGSMLASLSTFRSMAFSASDYYEQGESIVHRAL
jgi:actin-related protein